MASRSPVEFRARAPRLRTAATARCACDAYANQLSGKFRIAIPRRHGRIRIIERAFLVQRRRGLPPSGDDNHAHWVRRMQAWLSVHPSEWRLRLTARTAKGCVGSVNDRFLGSAIIRVTGSIWFPDTAVGRYGPAPLGGYRFFSTIPHQSRLAERH